MWVCGVWLSFLVACGFVGWRNIGFWFLGLVFLDWFALSFGFWWCWVSYLVGLILVLIGGLFRVSLFGLCEVL